MGNAQPTNKTGRKVVAQVSAAVNLGLDIAIMVNCKVCLLVGILPIDNKQ